MRVPLEYASYQIEGQLEQAVGTLEEGRTLLWFEMRSLRTLADQRRKDNPALADKLLASSKALEAVATSISLARDPHGGAMTLIGTASVHEEMDGFGRVLKAQRSPSRAWCHSAADSSDSMFRTLLEGGFHSTPSKTLLPEGLPSSSITVAGVATS